jgi:hypothetical protein
LDSDTVAVFSGCVAIADGYGLGTKGNDIREVVRVQGGGVFPQEIGNGRTEEGVAAGGLQSSIEVVGGGDVLKPGGVEAAEGFLEIWDDSSVEACLPPFDLFAEVPVVFEEGVRRIDLLGREGRTDEEFGGFGGMGAAVADGSLAEDESAEPDAFGGEHASGFTIPVGVIDGGAAELGGDLEDPFGVDTGDSASEGTRGLD